MTWFYKDEIGSSYRATKAAAVTAVFEGVSASHFKRHYWPLCRALNTDYGFAKVVFFIVRQIQKRRFAPGTVLRMVNREQQTEERQQRC